MKPEQLSGARQEVYRAGEVRFGHQSHPVNCLVCDCSDLGALIEISVTDIVPDTFRLVAPWAALDRFAQSPGELKTLSASAARIERSVSPAPAKH